MAGAIQTGSSGDLGLWKSPLDMGLRGAEGRQIWKSDGVCGLSGFPSPAFLPSFAPPALRMNGISEGLGGGGLPWGADNG